MCIIRIQERFVINIDSRYTCVSMSQTQLFTPESVEEIIIPESDNVAVESDRAGGEAVSVEDALMQRLSVMETESAEEASEWTDIRLYSDSTT